MKSTIYIRIIFRAYKRTRMLQAVAQAQHSYGARYRVIAG